MGGGAQQKGQGKPQPPQPPFPPTKARSVQSFLWGKKPPPPPSTPHNPPVHPSLSGSKADYQGKFLIFVLKSTTRDFVGCGGLPVVVGKAGVWGGGGVNDRNTAKAKCLGTVRQA